MMSYLNNDCNVMNCFAKFEISLAHSIIIPSFMTVGCQMLELDQTRGLFAPPPYKLNSQNTPYNLGLNEFCNDAVCVRNRHTDRDYVTFSLTISSIANVSHSKDSGDDLLKACRI